MSVPRRKSAIFLKKIKRHSLLVVMLLFCLFFSFSCKAEPTVTSQAHAEKIAKKNFKRLLLDEKHLFNEPWSPDEFGPPIITKFDQDGGGWTFEFVPKDPAKRKRFSLTIIVSTNGDVDVSLSKH